MKAFVGDKGDAINGQDVVVAHSNPGDRFIEDLFDLRNEQDLNL